ncbi:hypothetical protein A3715_07565 [Oleiphilus sp. HI0009]|nr:MULTISPECIES: hypothetical protein [unclassified Oleiphilus]KZX81379.1 hypothetical protein A3715_07565 [Oleiphilus sp. HI0009]KZY61911.1 hypothetical protein A3738_13300 [Oleiphilus sp. HI0066]KZY75549.1 hypothetical protein A3739_02215 [Oleiphilus sp. HI0067]MCH2159642.1 hypothetical protein [Oleiphilaceae bacterium]
MSLDLLCRYHNDAVYACFLPSFDQSIPTFDIGSQHFICFIGGDFRPISDGKLARLASDLLAQGACYFVCWGSDSERFHDLIEDMLLGDVARSAEEAIVMNSWHVYSDLSEALLFFLCHASPSSSYTEQSISRVAITLAQEDNSKIIQTFLSQPELYVD